ncbi:Hypothetical predicted protein [Paramuricea clavata]|uniref:Uncharacterized protein n=1 Tax=Paramuricea clavata TaxID=317549 RepID=A0A7D9IYM1_PARCT|nr:Hypothetical predicted protein [Paramuricea clavata]
MFQRLFAIPGVFSVLAGYKKQSSLLAVALGTHVLGIILAIVGMYLGAWFWAMLDSNCADSYGYNSSIFDPSASCSDLKTVREATGAVTIFFALFAIVTLVGSIYGCVGTCCARREPATIIVTTGQQPNTIMITAQARSSSNRQPLPNTVVMTTQTYPAYSQVSQQPPPYDPPAGQGQMVVDSKAC